MGWDLRLEPREVLEARGLRMQGVCQTDIIMLFAQELLIHITKQCDPEWFLRMVLGSWAISRKVVEACVKDSSTVLQNSPALCTQYMFRHILQ